MIQRARGKFEWLKAAPGFVLAGLEGIQYGEAELTLQNWDVFFAYTDGVTEAMNSAENLYGNDRLIDTLNANATKGLKAEELVRSVREDVAAYADGTEQADDITLLALRYIGIKSLRNTNGRSPKSRNSCGFPGFFGSRFNPDFWPAFIR